MEQFEQKSQIIHVVAAVIWHSTNADTFLISRRQQGKHLEHLWELPGGKKKPEESAVEALARELLEEVNVDDIDAAPFMQVTHHYPDRSILLDVWEVRDYSGEVYGREGQAIRWVPFDKINEYQFPDADKPVLEAIVSNVST